MSSSQKRGSIVNSNLSKQIQELIETENRFYEDLLMVRKVFMQGLANILGTEGIEKVFLNWDQLIKISKRLHTDLLKHPPGQVFIRRIDILEAFVQFCEGQQAAIAYLNQLEKTNPRFRRTYNQCVQDSKGMSLGYYLLLPMSRITRYPLIFEKMIKYSNSSDPEFEHLNDAYQLLKSLVSRANQGITEVENKNILCWSQQNINCDVLNRNLEFTSDTRELGPREYLHSGVLYKAKSNKMLVAFLYNDFLLLASPNEVIEDPDSFKVSKELSLHLTLYKTPFILDNLEIDSTVSASMDENSFMLKTKSMSLQLRAPSRNSKSFWVNQLQKALDNYDVKTQLKKAEEQRKSSIVTRNAEIGRILIEILNLTNLDRGINNILLKLHLDESDEPEHRAQIPVRENQSLYTTQFPLHSLKQKFHVSLFVPKQFRPDIRLGDVTEDIQKIVQIKGQHNGPLIRQFLLQNSEISGSNCEVNIKFAIQMFNNF